MMFPNVFHTYLTDDGLIAISVRSDQTRADEFYFCKEDIEPALDDDPNDDIWSGSAVFQLKRRRNSGGIRIKENNHWIYWTTSRQDIEILNAHLKGLCEQAPNDVERLGGSVTYAQFAKQPSLPSNFMDDLKREIRTVIREELHKIILSQIAPISMAQREKKIDPIKRPQDTFIPTHLSSSIDGAVEAADVEQEGDRTLEAARKLKELKK